MADKPDISTSRTLANMVSPKALSRNESVPFASSGALNQMDSKDIDFIYLVLLAAFGTATNTLLVIASTRREGFFRGNVFFCYTALVDCIITIAVVPISTMMMFARDFQNLRTCRLVQLITEACNYSYSLFFLLLSLGDFYYHCLGDGRIYSNARILTLTTTVLTVSFTMAGLGISFELDYDYCERHHFGNIYFRIATIFVFYVMPGIGTVFCLSLCCASVRSWSRGVNVNRARRFYDFNTTCLNMVSYILFVAFWTPYLIVVNFFPDANDNIYYSSVWFGVSRSSFSSLINLCLDNICTLLMLRDICGWCVRIFSRSTPNVVIVRDRPSAVVEMNPVGPEPEDQELQETQC